MVVVMLVSARGLTTEIEIPETWDDEDTTRTTSVDYPFTYYDPIYETGTYRVPCRIEWGDGTFEDFTTGTHHTHQYTSAGRYTVRYSSATGFLPFMRFAIHYEVWGNKQIRKVSYANFKSTKLAPQFLTWEDATRADGLEYFTFDYFRNSGDVTPYVGNLLRSQAGMVDVKVGNESFQHNTNITAFDCVLWHTTINEIPPKIFWRQSAALDFYSAFSGCSNITFVPEKLFKDCVNAYGFWFVFTETSITTVPADVFTYSSTAAEFLGTFQRCKKLISVPYNLFEHNTESTVFSNPEQPTKYGYGTFVGCTAMTSKPPKIPTSAIYVSGIFYYCDHMLGVADSLWDEAEYPNIAYHSRAYYNCSSLSNYLYIPDGWKWDDSSSAY